jgi:hypothetical protein
MSSQAYLTSVSKGIKKVNDDSQMKVSTDHHAELHGLDSESLDWMEAKAEIDNLLKTSKSVSDLLKKSKEVSNYWDRVRVQRRYR